MAGEPGSVNYLHAFLSPSIILGKNSLAPTSDLCRCPSLEHLRKGLGIRMCYLEELARQACNPQREETQHF